jgi:hypothetical protein
MQARTITKEEVLEIKSLGDLIAFFKPLSSAERSDFFSHPEYIKHIFSIPESVVDTFCTEGFLTEEIIQAHKDTIMPALDDKLWVFLVDRNFLTTCDYNTFYRERTEKSWSTTRDAHHHFATFAVRGNLDEQEIREATTPEATSYNNRTVVQNISAKLSTLVYKRATIQTYLFHSSAFIHGLLRSDVYRPDKDVQRLLHTLISEEPTPLNLLCNLAFSADLRKEDVTPKLKEKVNELFVSVFDNHQALDKRAITSIHFDYFSDEEFRYAFLTLQKKFRPFLRQLFLENESFKHRFMLWANSVEDPTPLRHEILRCISCDAAVIDQDALTEQEGIGALLKPEHHLMATRIDMPEKLRYTFTPKILECVGLLQAARFTDLPHSVIDEATLEYQRFTGMHPKQEALAERHKEFRETAKETLWDASEELALICIKAKNKELVRTLPEKIQDPRITQARLEAFYAQACFTALTETKAVKDDAEAMVAKVKEEAEHKIGVARNRSEVTPMPPMLERQERKKIQTAEERAERSIEQSREKAAAVFNQISLATDPTTLELLSDDFVIKLFRVFDTDIPDGLLQSDYLFRRCIALTLKMHPTGPREHISPEDYHALGKRLQEGHPQLSLECFRRAAVEDHEESIITYLIESEGRGDTFTNNALAKHFTHKPQLLQHVITNSRGFCHVMLQSGDRRRMFGVMPSTLLKLEYISSNLNFAYCLLKTITRDEFDIDTALLPTIGELLKHAQTMEPEEDGVPPVVHLTHLILDRGLIPTLDACWETFLPYFSPAEGGSHCLPFVEHIGQQLIATNPGEASQKTAAEVFLYACSIVPFSQPTGAEKSAGAGGGKAAGGGSPDKKPPSIVESLAKTCESVIASIGKEDDDQRVEFSLETLSPTAFQINSNLMINLLLHCYNPTEYTPVYAALGKRCAEMPCLLELLQDVTFKAALHGPNLGKCKTRDGSPLELLSVFLLSAVETITERASPAEKTAIALALNEFMKDSKGDYHEALRFGKKLGPVEKQKPSYQPCLIQDCIEILDVDLDQMPKGYQETRIRNRDKIAAKLKFWDKKPTAAQRERTPSPEDGAGSGIR